MARRHSTGDTLPPLAERAVEAIDAAVRGGDTLPAWTAVWELVQRADAHEKQRLLDALVERQASLDLVAVELSRTYAEAVQHSMRPAGRDALLPSREVRRQGQRDQIEAGRRAMEKLGVRPGDGIPMWALYMTRRSKRSFGG